MKYLIFSDSHLSPKFDPNKFAFLKRIVSQADRVIINGDFWEGYDFTFSQFINSPWNKLFTLLKKKQTVYVFGNHDKKKFSDHRVKLFSVKQAKEYKLKIGGKTFYFEHGDRLAPLLDIYFKKYPRSLNIIFDKIEQYLLLFFGKLHLYLYFRLLNKKIKRRIRGKFKRHEFFVCGHTNFAELDFDNNFLNSGFIKHGIGYYLTINEGKIKLHEERY